GGHGRRQGGEKRTRLPVRAVHHQADEVRGRRGVLVRPGGERDPGALGLARGPRRHGRQPQAHRGGAGGVGGEEVKEGSKEGSKGLQSRCAASHSFAAFTSASKAQPLSSSARLSAGSSGCSMPVSSSGILSSRTAFISRPISPAACAGVCMITSRRMGKGLLGTWQFSHCASRIRSARVRYVKSSLGK